MNIANRSKDPFRDHARRGLSGWDHEHVRKRRVRKNDGNRQPRSHMPPSIWNPSLSRLCSSGICKDRQDGTLYSHRPGGFRIICHARYIGPLRAYVTRCEVSLRDTSHDFKHANYDFSRCSFTYHRLPALSGHVFCVFEVIASTITGIFTIDHRTQKHKSGGMVAQLSSVGHIEDAIVLHADKTNDHCYTYTLPEELQHADKLDAWAVDFKRHENVVVEYYHAEWEESLAAARLTEVSFHTPSAPSCPICQCAGQNLAS